MVNAYLVICPPKAPDRIPKRRLSSPTILGNISHSQSKNNIGSNSKITVVILLIYQIDVNMVCII